MDNIIERNIEKGVKLMEEALRAYSRGSNISAYETLGKAESYLKEAYDMEKTDAGRDIAKYGDNLNFGALYKVFEANTNKLFRSGDSRGAIKDVVNLINENKVLKDQFAAYNAFTNPENVTNAQDYVTEAMSIVPKYSKEVLAENNRKLMETIRKHNLDENVKFSDEETGVFEGVEYMMTHTKGFGNIKTYGDIQASLCEFVERNNRVAPESVDLDEKYDRKVNEIADKYGESLTDDEMEIVMAAQDPKKSREMFESLKGELVGELGKLVKEGPDAESWGVILEKVESKVFNADTALEDIAELTEVRNELSE